MSLSELIVDFDLNPREKSDSTIDEFVDVMHGYKEKHLTFDEGWNQRIEATEDKIVTKGSHSLLAALQVYGPQHQITVKIHEGISGREKAAFLSATSNIHGKPYKPGERKKAIFQVLEHTQNLRNDSLPGKDIFLSLRDIASLTGISKGYVYELRRDFRAENGLPTDKGKIFTVEELAEIRLKEQNKKPESKSAQPEPTAEPTVEDEPQVVKPALTKEEADNMDDEELMEKLKQEYGGDNGEFTEPQENASDGDPLEQPPNESEEAEESEEEEEYYSDSDGSEPPDEYLQEAEPGVTPAEPADTDINSTDIVPVNILELKNKVNSERNAILKGTKSLMDDYLRLDENEANEALEHFRGEVAYIRNDDGLWDPDVDPECNGRDIVSSIILNLLDRLKEEYENYREDLGVFLEDVEGDN